MCMLLYWAALRVSPHDTFFSCTPAGLEPLTFRIPLAYQFLFFEAEPVGLVHTQPNIFFYQQLFPSGYGFCPHVSGECGYESGYFKVRSPAWKKINPQRTR